MAKVDWSKALVRCSCIGKIMTNGAGAVLTDIQAEELKRLENLPNITEKQKITLAGLIAKRDAPPKLSDTCISYLKELYVWHKYGKEPVGGAERSKYTLKGKSVEDESIMLISRIYGKVFIKNIQRFNNQYLTGEPDILVMNEAGEIITIIDAKSSWDYATLLAVVDSPLNPLYFWQMQGYMALTGAKSADVCHCLVSMPQTTIEGEKKRIFYTMNPATEQDPEYLKAIQRVEFNLTFDEIPINERIVRFRVDRDDDLIQKIYKKVDACRDWLVKFEETHMNLAGAT